MPDVEIDEVALRTLLAAEQRLSDPSLDAENETDLAATPLVRATVTTSDEPILTTLGTVPRSTLRRILVVEDRPEAIVVAEEFGQIVDGAMRCVKRNVYVTLKYATAAAGAIAGGM